MKNEDIILAQTVKLKMIDMLKHSIISDSFRYIMKHFEDESMTAVDIFESVLCRLDSVESSLNYAYERAKLAEARYDSLLSTYAERLSLQPKQIVLEVKDQKMADSIISAINYDKAEGDTE
jgi:hypothetical protein